MKKQTKFSLIELLIVIAIIGILASMLLPALSKARKSAQSASCKNNLKQIAQAVLVYGMDHENYAPADRFSLSSTSLQWHQTLDSLDYLAYESNNERSSYNCPNGLTINASWQNNYALNFRVGRGNASGSFSTLKTSYQYLSKLESSHSSETMLLVDGYNNNRFLQSSEISSNTIFELSSEAKIARHNDKCNLAFIDGHVESMAGSVLLSKTGYQTIFWTP